MYISILSNYTTASRGFSATARLYINDRPNAEITHSTLIFTAVTWDTAIAENHAIQPVKATMIENMWLFYSAKKYYNWSQLRSLTLVAKHSIRSVTRSHKSWIRIGDITNAFHDIINSLQDITNWILDTMREGQENRQFLANNSPYLRNGAT